MPSLMSRLLQLVCLPGPQNPDEKPDDEKSTWREQHQSVGFVPATIALAAATCVTPNNVPLPNNSRKKPTIIKIRLYPSPLPTPSRKLSRTVVLHRKPFRPAHHDTVGDNQTDKHGEFFAQSVTERFENLVNDNHQRGNDRHLHDDPNAAGNPVANQRDTRIRKRRHEDYGNRHRQRGRQSWLSPPAPNRSPGPARQSGCC